MPSHVSSGPLSWAKAARMSPTVLPTLSPTVLPTASPTEMPTRFQIQTVPSPEPHARRVLSADLLSKEGGLLSDRIRCEYVRGRKVV